MRLLATTTSKQLLHVQEGGLVTMGGMLTKIKRTTTKKTNEQMAVCVLEDLEGEVETLIFPGSYQQLAGLLIPNAVVFVEGRVAVRDDRPRLIAQQIMPMAQGAGKLVQSIEFLIRHSEDKQHLEELKELLARFPGSVPVYLRLETPGQASMQLKLSEQFQVDPTPEVLDELVRLFGEAAIVIKRLPPKAPAPFAKPRFSGVGSFNEGE